MKTFKQFLEEGKIKKLAKKIIKDIEAQRKENPSQIVQYPESKPNSKKRLAITKAMEIIGKRDRREMKSNLQKYQDWT